MKGTYSQIDLDERRKIERWRRADISVDAICAGWIETGILDAGFDLANDPAKAKEDALARHAMRRFGQSEDIAQMAL